MKNVWKKNNKLIICIFLYILITTTSLMVYTILNTADYTKSLTKELVVDIKTSYMEETIDNLIIRLETMEEDMILAMEDHIKSIKMAIEQQEPEQIDVAYLKNTIEQHTHNNHPVDVLVYDRHSGALVYQSTQTTSPQRSIVDEIETIKKISPSVEELQAGQYNMVLYVTWEHIYEMTKAKVYNEIHNMRYDENQYIWVHQILNYDGGDDYAIRLIHPNMQETEGKYLSTNTQDVFGDFPYLVELNGIKEHGEIIHSYHFKNLMNDENTEKVSYARLYEKYDWIIATGIPTGDLNALATDIDHNSLTFIAGNMLITFLVFIVGMMLSLYYLIHKQKEYIRSLEYILKEETELDALTGAFSRKYGNDYAKKRFQTFIKKGTQSAVLLVDVDDFKIVNDTYGHAVGDVVLQQATKTALNIIGPEHCFSRWGGEEFVAIIDDMTQTQAEMIANDIVNQIARMEFDGNGKTFNVSVSIGGSVFLESDAKYEDALQRADNALYYVKRNGKNAVLFNVPIAEKNEYDTE